MREEGPTRENSTVQLDERRLSRGLYIGLPLVTVTVAALVGVLISPATSILVIASGVMLGVIALLWGSIRVLSGDAPLPPELEDLEMASQGVDALASRKKMLLRALKDLESEHAIGKIQAEDYAQLSLTYREDLKVVLKKIDDSLAPHRAKAEDAVRSHMIRAGLVDSGYRGEPAPDSVEREERRPKATSRRHEADGTSRAESPWRVECPTCGASNERDAKFCKECATKLSASGKKDVPALADSSESEDDLHE